MFLDRYPFFTSIILYLDPGSGSFLIQLLLAVILGAGVAVRLYWSKIKSLFIKKDAPSEAAAERDEIEE